MEYMSNVFDKAFKQADKANKREKLPVFLHCTYRGISMAYKHLGVIAQPTYMVNNGQAYDVTYNIDNNDFAPCCRYNYLHSVN
jgi:hypothetical protein